MTQKSGHVDLQHLDCSTYRNGLYCVQEHALTKQALPVQETVIIIECVLHCNVRLQSVELAAPWQ